MNAKSLKNPKPFKKGQSGNPAGRLKRRPITEECVTIAEAPIPENERKKLKLPKGATFALALARKYFQLAMKGDIRAVREIREAIEGKSKQSFAEEEIPMWKPAEADPERLLASQLATRWMGRDSFRTGRERYRGRSTDSLARIRMARQSPGLVTF